MDKNLPLLLNLSYYGYNRGIEGDFKPVLDLQGNVVKTFCNEFIDYICRGMGYYWFKDMLANDMVDFMSNPVNHWIAVSDEVAQDHANEGVIVIAGMKNQNGHGHVNLIIPGILEKSVNFGKSVPKCVNIGKDVFYGKKISFAFPSESPPTYFAYGLMI